MTKLQPSVSHDFGNAIWRMEIDQITADVIIELRNQTDKQVSFAAVNLKNGKLNFEHLVTDERWLTGIECIHQGIALLHYYKHENGPEHKGILAIDAATGRQLWSNYTYGFDHLSINGPVVYNTALQPKKLLLANITTGAIERIYQDTDKPLINSVVAPSLVSSGNLALPPFMLDAVGNMVHYLRFNNYRIVSLHTLKNSVLQQHLFIIHGDELLYTDLLNKGIQKLQPEAFVLHNNTLVYIKNKTELIALQL